MRSKKGRVGFEGLLPASFAWLLSHHDCKHELGHGRDGLERGARGVGGVGRLWVRHGIVRCFFFASPLGRESLDLAIRDHRCFFVRSIFLVVLIPDLKNPLHHP